MEILIIVGMIYLGVRIQNRQEKKNRMKDA